MQLRRRFAGVELLPDLPDQRCRTSKSSDGNTWEAKAAWIPPLIVLRFSEGEKII